MVGDMEGIVESRIRFGARGVRLALACLACWLLTSLPSCGGKEDRADAAGATDLPGDAAFDVGDDIAHSDAVDDVPLPKQVKPLKELHAGKITQKVRFVFDKLYEGKVDVGALEDYVLTRELREADDYTTLTATTDWWDDWQDVAQILYYSAEHVFSSEAPYPGATFMPHIWKDMRYGVSDVTIEFADLSQLYAAVDKRKMKLQEAAGTEWTLLNANDGLAWAREQYPHDPNEMVVVVTANKAYEKSAYSYYFIEEEYGKERGFSGYNFNVRLDEWPEAMQTAEGLTPHDVPIWMHFAFLNGEWDAEGGAWRLFPNTRWGGYESDGIYFIEGIQDLGLNMADCEEIPPYPASHYYLDEQKFKVCLDNTERIEFDWYRLWRHAFNVPSFPFWWSEKVDVRIVVVDLREYTDGEPEYEEKDVIDWTTVEDSIREANPLANLTVQRYNWVPPGEIRKVLIDNLITEAGYPMHSYVNRMANNGTWNQFTMDWHQHFDISGLPGMQTYLAAKLAAYFGGEDAKGKPLDYSPFAAPYHETGKPFIVPGIFFLTPHKQFDGTLGGWTTNTGDLICIMAMQFGYTCEQVNEMMEKIFGGPVGPNLMAWSDAYCLWWEVFVVDWTYTPSPVKTLRWILDPKPFHEMLQAIPEVGQLIDVGAPELFDMVFGRFHPWATGFPFWLKETLDDSAATELSREFASYQFAESIQHNIGYKHQTTVIFDSPYLGMENGFDYRRHRDLKETFEMTDEEASMPFYSTEPGSRDFPIDANSYMTHKMGTGTIHMLQRIFARREIVALYEILTETDPTYETADADFQQAVADYVEATKLALKWDHAGAYGKALDGLAALDRHLAANGKPDRIFSDWDSKVEFTPAATGIDITPEQLDKDLKKIGGKVE